MGGICCREAEPEFNPDGSPKEPQTNDQKTSDPIELRRAAKDADLGVMDEILPRMPKAQICQGAPKTDGPEEEAGFTALHFSASINHLRAVKKLVLYEAAIDARSADKRTPLNVAVNLGKRKVTNFLLDKGANINNQDAQGNFPLLSALSSGRLQTANLLMSHAVASQGLNYDLVDKDGNSVVLVAARYMWTDMLQTTLAKVVDPRKLLNIRNKNGETVLGWVLKYAGANKIPIADAERLVQLLLSKGAMPTVPAFPEMVPPVCLAAAADAIAMYQQLVQAGGPNFQAQGAQDALGRGPLHYAAGRGAQALVVQLLGEGMQPYQQDKAGNTPLHLAVSRGQLEVVKLLIDKCDDRKAAVLAVNKAGMTAFHLSLLAGPSEAAQDTSLHLAEIVGDQISVAVADLKQDTPLLLACQGHQHRVVELLISKNADVNGANALGEVPLSCIIGSATAATANEDVSIFDQLMNKNVDINAGKGDGHPLLKICQTKMVTFCKKVMEVLRSKGIALSWDILDSSGCTPLMLAAAGNNDFMCKHLITEVKVDVNAQVAETGTTALMKAAEYGSVQAMKVLLNRGANPRLKDSANQSTLSFTMKRDIPESLTCASLLLAMGHPPEDCTDIAGEGLVHRAVRYGAAKFISCWAKYGGNLNLKASTAETADEVPGDAVVAAPVVDIIDSKPPEEIKGDEDVEEEEEEGDEEEAGKPKISAVQSSGRVSNGQGGMQVAVKGPVAEGVEPRSGSSRNMYGSDHSVSNDESGFDDYVDDSDDDYSVGDSDEDDDVICSAGVPVAESTEVGERYNSFARPVRGRHLRCWLRRDARWWDRWYGKPVANEEFFLKRGEGVEDEVFGSITIFPGQRTIEEELEDVEDDSDIDEHDEFVHFDDALLYVQKHDAQYGRLRRKSSAKGSAGYIRATSFKSAGPVAESLRMEEISEEEGFQPDRKPNRTMDDTVSQLEMGVGLKKGGSMGDEMLVLTPNESLANYVDKAEAANEEIAAAELTKAIPSVSAPSVSAVMSKMMSKKVSITDPYYSQEALYQGMPKYMRHPQDPAMPGYVDTSRWSKEAQKEAAAEVHSRIKKYKRVKEPELIGGDLRARNIRWYLASISPEEYPLKPGQWKGAIKKAVAATKKARERKPVEAGKKVAVRKKKVWFGLPDMPDRLEWNGSTPLLAAIRLNRPECMDAILKYSHESLNVADGFGYTPLSYAMMLLLQHRSNPTLAYMVDRLLTLKPLVNDSLQKKAQKLESIVADRPTIMSPLTLGVLLEDRSRLAYMVLYCHGDLNRPRTFLPDVCAYNRSMMEKYSKRCESIVAPLHLAILSGRYNLVKCVLDLGANANVCGIPKDAQSTKDKLDREREKEKAAREAEKRAKLNGEKPAMGASTMKNIKMLMKMVSRIEIPFITKPNPWLSPLHLAARMGQAQTCALLIDRKADINGGSVKLYARRTPVQEALNFARRNYIEANTDAGRHNWIDTLGTTEYIPEMSQKAQEDQQAEAAKKFIKMMDPSSMALKAAVIAVKYVIKMVLEMRKRPIVHADPAISAAHVLLLHRSRLDFSETQTTVVLRDIMDNDSWLWLLEAHPEQAWVEDAKGMVEEAKQEYYPKMEAAEKAKLYNKLRVKFMKKVDTIYYKQGTQSFQSNYKKLATLGNQGSGSQREAAAAQRSTATAGKKLDVMRNELEMKRLRLHQASLLQQESQVHKQRARAVQATQSTMAAGLTLLEEDRNGAVEGALKSAADRAFKLPKNAALASALPVPPTLAAAAQDLILQFEAIKTATNKAGSAASKLSKMVSEGAEDALDRVNLDALKADPADMFGSIPTPEDVSEAESEQENCPEAEPEEEGAEEGENGSGDESGAAEEGAEGGEEEEGSGDEAGMGMIKKSKKGAKASVEALVKKVGKEVKEELQEKMEEFLENPEDLGEDLEGLESDLEDEVEDMTEKLEELEDQLAELDDMMDMLTDALEVMGFEDVASIFK